MNGNSIVFYTIGVYGYSETQFFEKLLNNQIDCFCDIRQRRGVRGKAYSFVNSIKLQAKLKSLDIYYEHILELAPTSQIRKSQKEEDLLLMVKKRDREMLGQVFEKLYIEQVLNSFNIPELISRLKLLNFNNIVFFCVESSANACHRSLVAKEIINLGYNVINL